MNNPQPTLHLVIADDDPDELELLQEAVAQQTFPITATIVTDGLKLMHMLYAEGVKADALILDMNMPCKDGMECIAEIRQQDDTRQLLIIGFSNSSYPGKKEEVIAAGADHYVVKPSTYEEYVEIVNFIYHQFVAKGRTAGSV